MNIAEVTTYKEGGAYTHVIELVKGLESNSLIVVGNTKKTGLIKENGNDFFHAPLLKSIWDIFFVNKPGSYQMINEFFEKNDIDLVHFHSPLFTFIYGFLRGRKYPLIITTHYLLDIKEKEHIANIYRHCIRWMTLFIAKNVDKIICVNEDYIPIFIKWGVKPEKLIYIPNGVDTQKFSPGPSEVKKKFKDDKIVLYFGRLHYQKNVDLLIRSFPIVQKKMNNAKLIIVGSGNQYDKLKKLSESNKDIIMTGFVSDEELVDYMRSADIVVFPSRGENASFTIMEAMACELPVVSSDVGNAKKIFADDRGILLKDYTEQEIADICLEVLNNTLDGEAIGKKAREYVIENHSWDKISEKTDEVYRNLVEKKKSQ